MIKRDLKKMALLGLATGLLLANQGTVEAQAPEASSNEGEFLAGLTQEGQLLYQSLDAEGQHMARLIVSHDCGANDGLGGCNDAGCYTTTSARGGSGCYGAGGATGWNAGCGSGCGSPTGPRGTYLAGGACGGGVGGGCGGGGGGGAGYYYGGSGGCGGGGQQGGSCGGGGGGGYYYGGNSYSDGSGLPASCGGGSSCNGGYEPPRGLKSGKPDNQTRVIQGQPKNVQKKSSSGIKDSNMQQQQSYQPYQQQRNS